MVYPVQKSACLINSRIAVLELWKLELRSGMLQHPSSYVSYLDTCNKIPACARNKLLNKICTVIFPNQLYVEIPQA